MIDITQLFPSTNLTLLSFILIDKEKFSHIIEGVHVISTGFSITEIFWLKRNVSSSTTEKALFSILYLTLEIKYN